MLSAPFVASCGTSLSGILITGVIIISIIICLKIFFIILIRIISEITHHALVCIMSECLGDLRKYISVFEVVLDLDCFYFRKLELFFL